MTKIVTPDDYQEFARLGSVLKLDTELNELNAFLTEVIFKDNPAVGVEVEDTLSRAATSIRMSFYTLGFAGESGEVVEKVKKGVRGDYDVTDISEEKRREIGLEIGDALWYLTNITDQLGFSLTEVMQMNVEKLEDRRARGKSRGDGDNR